MWITDDPENVFDFSAVTDEKYKQSITVTKIEDTNPPAPITTTTANYGYSEYEGAFVDVQWLGYDEAGQGDVVSYRIYRSAIDFSDITGMTPTDVSIRSQSYKDTDIIPGNGYYYAVTAVDELGQENPAVTAVHVYVPVMGSISGTVYQSDGVTPLTGKNIQVDAYTGSCEYFESVRSGSVDPVTGTYKIDLPPGTYRLTTDTQENYFSEWWASPESVRHCASAQTIEVAEGQNVEGKNFQLDAAAAISGTVYGSDETMPVSGGNVYAYTGDPCSFNQVGSAQINADGTYTIERLATGSYYLLARATGNYVSAEWWADPLSVMECGNAQAIAVAAGEVVTGKNFQLDAGATISGTVYQSDGTTSVTGGGRVLLISGNNDPCNLNYAYSGPDINSTDGTYTIEGLPTGTYYLFVYTYPLNYASEWWASQSSVIDCSAAQTISVTAGDTVTGKDFQLDTGATISGTVYQSDGITPVTGGGGQFWVEVLYSGDPCNTSRYLPTFSYINDADGTYTVKGLPAGTYYIKTNTFGAYWMNGGLIP